jgi:hypothetical protein
MADAGVQIKKRRTFKKFTFRGVDLDQLLAIKSENLIELLGCRARRHFNRGIKRREENLLKRLRKVILINKNLKRRKMHFFVFLRKFDFYITVCVFFTCEMKIVI